MNTKTIRFIRRGAVVALNNVPPERTLLEVLRDDLGCSGSKEGCNEGDCGACTVVLAEPEGGALRYRAVNSCIRLAHSVDAMALWTVEDLAAANGSLHPAQEAMVQCHGSQCGFCTPGFVMSMFGMYQNHVAQGRTITRALAQEELSGNLCRCTGYRPILDAAQQMASYPRVDQDAAVLVGQLQQLALAGDAEPVSPTAMTKAGPPASGKGHYKPDTPAYLAPRTLADLLVARASHPDAQIVAGCTDVGLWVTKQHRRLGAVLDVTRAAELRQVAHYPHHIAIGAAVSLSDAFAAMARDRPQLRVFANRFAGLPVRNSGTLGGNVANGSPIGDSMPLLIALGANVVLMSSRGHREMPLEAMYTGYRSTVLADDEILAWIKVPLPTAGEFSRVYKISKRFDDDISAICLAISLHVDHDQVVSASIGVGGVAATPVRAQRTQALLQGQRWSADLATQAGAMLRSEFQPISDMRASADYRSTLLANLMQRFWLESQGMQGINLESPMLQGATA